MNRPPSSASLLPSKKPSGITPKTAHLKWKTFSKEYSKSTLKKESPSTKSGVTQFSALSSLLSPANHRPFTPISSRKKTKKPPKSILANQGLLLRGQRFKRCLKAKVESELRTRLVYSFLWSTSFWKGLAKRLELFDKVLIIFFRRKAHYKFT